MSEIDNILENLDDLDLRELEKTLIGSKGSVDDNQLNMKSTQSWLYDRMIKSTNEPPIPTALIQREKEVREWHQKRQAQEEKRQQMYEDEKSDFSRQEINELEELLASGTKSENCFASMPKGSLQKKNVRRRNRKKYVKRYTDLNSLLRDLNNGLIKNLDFTEFRYISVVDIEKVLSNDNSLSKVEKVNMPNMSISDVNILSTIINKSRTLSELNLSTNNLDTTQICKLLDLAQNSTLTVIKLGAQRPGRSQSDEEKILKRLKMTKLRRFELEWRIGHVRNEAERHSLQCI